MGSWHKMTRKKARLWVRPQPGVSFQAQLLLRLDGSTEVALMMTSSFEGNVCLFCSIRCGLYLNRNGLRFKQKITPFREYAWLLRGGNSWKTHTRARMKFNPGQPNRHDADFGMSLKCLPRVGQTALPPSQAGRAFPWKPFDKKKQAPGRRATHYFLRPYCPQRGDCDVGLSLRAAPSGPRGGSYTMQHVLPWAIHGGLKVPWWEPIDPRIIDESVFSLAFASWPLATIFHALSPPARQRNSSSDDKGPMTLSWIPWAGCLAGGSTEGGGPCIRHPSQAKVISSPPPFLHSHTHIYQIMGALLLSQNFKAVICSFACFFACLSIFLCLTFRVESILQLIW